VSKHDLTIRKATFADLIIPADPPYDQKDDPAGVRILDAFTALRALVLRGALLDQSQIKRVNIKVESGQGSAWKVTVILDVSDDLHSQQAEQPTVEQAVNALITHFAQRLELRIKSDCGALELAGRPFDWSGAAAKRVPMPWAEREVVDSPVESRSSSSDMIRSSKP
jgi:hypothetical protein